MTNVINTVPLLFVWQAVVISCSSGKYTSEHINAMTMVKCLKYVHVYT